MHYDTMSKKGIEILTYNQIFVFSLMSIMTNCLLFVDE